MKSSNGMTLTYILAASVSTLQIVPLLFTFDKQSPDKIRWVFDLCNLLHSREAFKVTVHPGNTAQRRSPVIQNSLQD